MPVLHLIGGRTRLPRCRDALTSRFPGADVRCHPCEKGRAPRLDFLDTADPSRAIAVVLTDFVGHGAYGSARATCERRGIPFVHGSGGPEHLAADILAVVDPERLRAPGVLGPSLRAYLAGVLPARVVEAIDRPGEWLGELLKVAGDARTLRRAIHARELAAELERQTAEQRRRALDRPLAPERLLELTAHARGPQTLAGLEPELAELLRRDVAPWMLFLFPSQRRAVERDFDGPHLVTGGAGTGKTVVALHRALRFAREVPGASVLLTTFVENLPRVWKEVLRGNLSGLELATVDDLARRLAGAGKLREVRGDERTEIARSLREGDPVLRAAFRTYRELIVELESIADRGVLHKYDHLRGAGRPSQEREATWRAYEAMNRRLAGQGLVTIHELRVRALRRLREKEVAPRLFDAIVCDEAQDLTQAQLELLALLDGSEDHARLTLVGDDRQAVYRDAPAYRAAGMSLSARRVELRENLRNTEVIQLAADALLDGAAGSTRPEDASESEIWERMDEVRLLRRGDDPVASCVAAVKLALAEAGGCEPGDVAVLAGTGTRRDAILAALSNAGVPARDLVHFRGRPSTEVWVGTMHRAKGLDFKRVVVADLDEWIETGGGPRERRVRLTRVAVLRARDLLYLSLPAEPRAAEVRRMIEATLVREVGSDPISS